MKKKLSQLLIGGIFGLALIFVNLGSSDGLTNIYADYDAPTACKWMDVLCPDGVHHKFICVKNGTGNVCVCGTTTRDCPGSSK